jgi:hypothetical protein
VNENFGRDYQKLTVSIVYIQMLLKSTCFILEFLEYRFKRSVLNSVFKNPTSTIILDIANFLRYNRRDIPCSRELLVLCSQSFYYPFSWRSSELVRNAKLF